MVNMELCTNLFPLFNGIYSLKDDDGYDIYPIFQALPDRKIADYYKTIKRPLSLHMMKNNLKKGRYEHPNEFIRDLAQIVWNAKTYNLKNSDIYNYAVKVDDYVKNSIIPKIKSDSKFQNYNNEIVYPDLGPLPEDMHQGVVRASPSPQAIGGTPTPQNHSQVHTPQTSVPPQLGIQTHQSISAMASSIVSSSNNSSTVNSPRIGSYSTTRRNNLSLTPLHQQPGELTYEAWCKRGRPPIIDRPHEQRIKNIMRTMKKVRNHNNQFIHIYFDKLPDVKEYPEYYRVIQNPISLDLIRVKIRQRNYATVEQFVEDLNLMFSNAKTYNAQGSQIFNDTLLLEMKAHEIIKEEVKRPDSAYLTADGLHNLKIPLDQVEVDGKIYKIGDWILVRNPNDPNTPIVAQLFRLWQTQDGKRWINVCWYYRPEQTVHRVDRLFYENEVCKSGQYRDHSADEIVGKCYVAYFTRYQRGDPGVQYEGPLFVCEYRYNDTDKGFNKIRTWKACLPDEVRHIEDPIIPLKSVRVMQKVESPLKHTLPPNASYDDPIPDPTLGHPNAPPLIGAVYLRPPDPKDDLGQYSTSTQPNKNNIPKAINNVKNVTNVPLPQRNIASSVPVDLRKNPDSMLGGPGVASPIVSPAAHQSPYYKTTLPGNGVFSATNNVHTPGPSTPYVPPLQRASPALHSPQSAQLLLPLVHHANSNYSSITSNFSYTLPTSIEAKLTVSEAVDRMDVQNAQRRLGTSNSVGFLEQKKHKQTNPIIWFPAPPISIQSKIQPSELLTLSNFTTASRKRVLETGESDDDDKSKKSKLENPLHRHTHEAEEEVVDAPAFGFAGQWSVGHSAKYLEWVLKKTA